jgi:anti-anti-sigma factor
MNLAKHDGATNTLSFTFPGRLDTVACVDIAGYVDEQIAARLDAGADQAGALKVIFDVAGVNFVGSSFVRICVAAAKRVREGNFALVNASPLIKKTFKIAGLDEILNVS